MKTPNLPYSQKRKQPLAWEGARQFLAAKSAKGLDRIYRIVRGRVSPTDTLLSERGAVTGSAGMDIDEVGVGWNDIHRPVHLMKSSGVDTDEPVSTNGEWDSVLTCKIAVQICPIQDNGKIFFRQRHSWIFIHETFDWKNLFEFRTQIAVVVEQPERGNHEQRNEQRDGNPRDGCRFAAEAKTADVEDLPDEH